MSIQIRPLGEIGQDNALYVQIDSGQTVERLLFDCGEHCLDTLSRGDIQAVDHLFFSHLHMDHVAGFDAFFRVNFNRVTKPNWIWGPPETTAILQHRLQGYMWNLSDLMSSTWHIADISPGDIHASRFEAREAFSIRRDLNAQHQNGHLVCEGVGYTVHAIEMDHRTPSLAYLVREKPRSNIDPAKLQNLSLKPGPWIKDLKRTEIDQIEVEGQIYSLAALRAELLTEKEGSSVAYLTDFLLNEDAMERLVAFLQPCQTVICEAQYRHAELPLAERNFHMTSVQAATLALRLQCEELILSHVSERYERPDWEALLKEAQAIFPSARFPDHWSSSQEKPEQNTQQ